MQRSRMLFYCFLLLLPTFWRCTPETSTEKTQEATPEAQAEPQTEPLPEWVEDSGPIEFIPPEGPHEVDTLTPLITFPPIRYVGDVKAIQGTAKSTADPIDHLALAIQDNTSLLYWDGTAFSQQDAKWIPLPEKDSFSFDTRAIPFQAGNGYTAYLRATNTTKGYATQPQSWRSGTPWTYARNRSPWRYLSGPIDGEFTIQGQQGIAYRVREKGAYQTPLGIGPIFASHRFQDQRTQIMLGAQGQIWRTTDDGIRWQKLAADKSPTTDIEAISVSIDEKILIAGGAQGRLYRSDDSGESWRAVGGPRGERIRQICRVDAKRWLALSDQPTGSVIYRSDEGGNNWTAITLPITDRRFYGMFCAEQQKQAVLVGDAGAILFSEQAGETWTDQSNTSITTDLRGIWRDQTGRWLAVGAKALVLESSDGKIWKALSGPQTDGPTLHDLRLQQDTKQGFVWGEQATWWKTEDGGKTWKPVVVPNGESNETFYATRFPQSPRVGFVVGEKSILSTEDAGLTWKTLRTDGPYYSLAFRDNFNGVVVGHQICRTEDGGKAWVCQPLGVDGPMYSVAFSNAEAGCAVGAKGALLCTTDGGRSWSQGILPTGETMRQIYFLNQETGYIAGDKASLFRSKDNGKTWLPATVTGIAGQDILSVSFPLSEDIGYIGGSGGLFLKTEDAGSTWTAIDLKTTQPIRLVYFPIGLTDGYVLAGETQLYRTEDSGQTWLPLPTLSTLPLHRLDFSQSARLGFAVGSDGTILLTRNGFE